MYQEQWHEVCLICGVPPNPPYIDCIQEVVESVMDNLPEHARPSLLDKEGYLKNAEKIEERVTTAMEVARDIFLRQDSFFDDCLLIGHFHKSYKFDVPWRLSRLPAGSKTKKEKKAKKVNTTTFTRLVLPGRGVQVRAGKGCHSSGDFRLTEEDEQSFAAIPNDPDDRGVNDDTPLDFLIHPPEATRGLRQSDKLTFKTSAGPDSYLGLSSVSENYLIPWEGFGNFWVTKGCFEFLKAWVSLPPVENGLYEAKGEEPLTFEEEFYEVVNSRKHGRKSGLGTMVEMEYDAMDFSPFEETAPCIQFWHSKAVAKVLARKGDDSELVKALLRDSGFWLYSSPHYWPAKANVEGQRSPSPIQTRIVVAIGCAIINLPMDTLETILKNLDDVRDYFALARTCMSLYNALQNPQRLNQVFREMAKYLSRCLFWIRPLRDSDELFGKRHPRDPEGSTTLHVLKEWCPQKDTNGQGVGGNSRASNARAVMEAFDDPAFEWVPFVRACYLSDPMRNRRRIWKQVKQIEAMWKDYRLNGWQVNRFITKNQGIRAW